MPCNDPARVFFLFARYTGTRNGGKKIIFGSENERDKKSGLQVTVFSDRYAECTRVKILRGKAKGRHRKLTVCVPKVRNDGFLLNMKNVR